MKKFIYIIALLFLLVACNEELQIDTKQPTIGNKTRAFTSQTFSFDSVTKPEIWKTFQTLEEMQSACQIPDDVLPNLSTEELVQICMDYPLFGNFSAYNDELVGIKKVMDGFNGFTELKKRTDAAEKLLDLYENVNVATLNSDKENIETYPNIKLGYLELILSSGEFESLYQGNLLQRLNILHEKKFNEKRISNNNSFFSLRHSELLQNKIQESNAKVSLKVRIFTKCGKPLIAYSISEMTSQEIAELNSFTIKTYPNATFLSNSSTTYNCHSFALKGSLNTTYDGALKVHNNGCFLKWTLTVTFCKEKRDDENYNDVFTSDDETLFKDTDIYTKRGNWPRYFSNIFSDQRFNGTQHKFTINVDLVAPREQTKLIVELQSITKELYFYLKSLMLYSITPQDEYTEAIQIYSNVTDGWGIVGAVNTDRHVITF